MIVAKTVEAPEKLPALVFEAAAKVQRPDLLGTVVRTRAAISYQTEVTCIIIVKEAERKKIDESNSFGTEGKETRKGNLLACAVLQHQSRRIRMKVNIAMITIMHLNAII